MASVTEYAGKRLLIIDDMPEMRSSLRSQATSIGFQKVTACGHLREALDALRQTPFDIILCDYYLGSGTNGQQFLEYLRTRRMIPRSTLFIMITAEKNHDAVITAAECMPDDYLLKPFTAELFKTRVERLLDRKARLAEIDAMQDKGRWAEVIATCDEIISARDRYQVDAMRIKGNALIQSGRHEEAAAYYRKINDMRPLPWARLGLSRALRETGKLDEAREQLTTLIAEAPHLMAAYDLLGHIHAAEGDSAAALQVLDDASRRSPHSLARLRAIAEVAESAGDFERVEKSLSQVVDKTRNTPLRETSDFARLGSALTATGQADKALAVVDEAREAFRGEAENPALAAVEAIAHHSLGNPAKAEAALERALQGGDLGLLPASAMLTLAQACLDSGRADQGQALLKQVVQTNPEAKDVHARVTSLMERHGSADQARKLVADSVEEVIQLNNDAVRFGKEGRIGEAAEMLTAAANRLPGNLQIVANAAYALLVALLANGHDADKLREAERFRQAVRERAPNHRKLADIDALWARLAARQNALE
ncbi:tetratricopeptide repeat protein [Pseudothauera nasutitermitis]|uniref:Tetratricopeptide repeat protein n=1 Tax=Pseudothauera nasutitermitis TaxID=2565930 RepID=A0A4S4B2R3_9RHOO|nr:tetratricopeptide repeat-containing response regulator [Pseudothauera nasutitermitis]THF66938.1 tetratricopeptide repeat protein [Pseudothauera nasutitermitis]